MARATISEEIHFNTQNEVALLGKITSALATEDIYIVHLSAYSVNEFGYLQAITKDNARAKEIISSYIKGKIELREVLVVEFENKVGTLAEVAKILGNHNINIRYVYGTSGDGFKIVGIFSTDNNQKAAEVINKETGSLA